MATLSPQGIYTAFDNNGDPLAGGLLYTYEAGTTTPKQTFNSRDESSANTNPIVLDSAGRAQIWLDSGSYKFVQHNSDDVLVWETDDITGGAGNVFGSQVVNISSNKTINTTEENYIFNATAALTVTLPSASEAEEGFVVTVKNSSASSSVIIDPDGSETINGSATLTLSSGVYAIIVSDGTNWITLDTAGFVILAGNNTITGNNTISGSTTFTGTVEIQGNDAELLLTDTFTGKILVDNGNLEVLSSAPTRDVKFGSVSGGITMTLDNTDGSLSMNGAIVPDRLVLGEIATPATPSAGVAAYAKSDNKLYQKDDSGNEKPLGVHSGTVQNTTSGTSVDITIPDNVKKIIISFAGVSASGTDDILIQLGDSGGLEVSGYLSSSSEIDSTPNEVTSTAGFIIFYAAATAALHGSVQLTLVDASTNTWVASGILSDSGTGKTITIAGSKSLSETLNQLRLTTTGGTNTFDAGKINVLYE